MADEERERTTVREVVEGRSVKARGRANAKNADRSAPKKSSTQSLGAPKAKSRGSKSETKNVPPASNAKETAKAATAHLIRQHELVDKVRAYDPHVNEHVLNRAYVFSMKAHGGQTRKSGDPYFIHPLAVASILTDLKADPATVATALLHDVVEDTDVTVEEISKKFGAEIAGLVDGVTKLSKIELKSEASKQAENFRKLVVAMADDVRVLLVKLADRLHNMRTLHFVPDAEKRRKVALETMEIYAPLAGRIGVQRFRDELEDIAFMELSPQAYESITKRLNDLQRNIVASVVSLAQTLRDNLASAGIEAEVHSREKRPYSIWRKMATKNVSFDELADIYAFRVIVETIEECYRALGVIHTTWRMIPTEFDDYISASKPNNYRSIHTAVIGPPRPDGGRQRIEIQIRTREMHETAERGVAAHWQYKDKAPAKGEKRPSVEIVAPGQYDPYETPRRLVEMFQQGEDPEEALRYAKLELFQDQVFCFTPKGRVIALPKGATALDFAYAVHTDVGDSCIGVKVNGVSRPLRTPLKNGDVVLVLRSENATVPPEWETMAITGRARSAIRRRVKKMRHAEHVDLGRQMAENVFQGAQLELSAKAITAALKKLGEKTVDGVFAKVGRGDLSVNQLVEAVYPGVSREAEGEIRAAGMYAFRPRLAIEGLPAKSTVLMGRCCSAIPGERIIGVREEGVVTVHAIDCEKLEAESVKQGQWIDLKWREKENHIAYAKVVVTVRNEIGVLSEIAGIIARYGVSIANIRLENKSPDFVELFVDIVVKDVRQLEQMLAGIRASAHVLSAERNERPGNEHR
ncbi:MAG: bifunctional (p)ppGpp synthetase/guanosine-3',5'-bis(diphosphate) 3'-pyrophosphohydrolase [Parvularculaceae bacterium]|nr:bifunctional (p)ppGpp synthetase/guanosine-3',5'-bis(diphosphate) 3'-pyrophosphohydrolase [Parvularculaceae bacterium]